MKQLFLAIIPALVLLFSSCAKDSGGNDVKVNSLGNPLKTDVSSLKKTTMRYTISGQDITSSDSTFTRWGYDANGRLTSQISSTQNFYDSAITIFSLNPEKEDYLEFFNHSIWSEITRVYFRTGTRLDSMSKNGYRANGATAGTGYNQMTYYFYDADGHDTLERCIESVTGTPELATLLHHVYTSGKLDSTVEENPGAEQRDVVIYSNGAPVSATTYVYGAPRYRYQYQYTNTPSGGYYNYTGTPYLVKQITTINGPTNTTLSTQNFDYKLDAENRVVEMNSTYAPKFIDAKEYYTY